VAEKQIPVLSTERLILRPFKPADAAEVQRLAGDEDIARNVLAMPYPYLDGMAESWIETQAQDFKDGKSAIFAITLKNNGRLAGAIGLSLQAPYQLAEMGYWVGKEFWGNGYCTEAVRAIIRFGFSQPGLHKISASHFSNNPASGRVMQKAGMKYEAKLLSHMLHWGEYKDLVFYGIWKEERN